MEEKNYRVLRIEEQLYGCEELPEGQPVLCDVLLEAADGTQRVLPYPDAELTRLDINEGSTVTLQDHRLTKAAHKVYFTRHGETVWNVENKICGMTDSPLTEKAAPRLGSWAKSSGPAVSGSMRSCTLPCPAPPTPPGPLRRPPAFLPGVSLGSGSSALAATRARPGTAKSSASPRPTLPTATPAARA